VELGQMLNENNRIFPEPTEQLFSHALVMLVGNVSMGPVCHLTKQSNIDGVYRPDKEVEARKVLSVQVFGAEKLRESSVPGQVSGQVPTM